MRRRGTRRAGLGGGRWLTARRGGGRVEAPAGVRACVASARPVVPTAAACKAFDDLRKQVLMLLELKVGRSARNGARQNGIADGRRAPELPPLRRSPSVLGAQKAVDTRVYEVQVLRSRREHLVTGKEVRGPWQRARVPHLARTA